MKSSITGPRNAANLSEAIHQQLNMYALVASAAGVGVLALTQPSEAKIVYTPANVQISGNQHYDLDLNDDGVTGFTITLFSHRTYCQGLCVARHLTEEPARSNSAIGKPPEALIAGSAIGHSNPFYDGAGAMAFFRAHCRDGCSFHGGGNWLGVTDRYLGLAFELHGKTHYGWARLNVAAGLTHATLTGYAYENAPGKSIKAGGTKRP